MKEALAEVADLKIIGRIINKMKFADDTAIIANAQDVVNGSIVIVRKYGS